MGGNSMEEQRGWGKEERKCAILNKIDRIPEKAIFELKIQGMLTSGVRHSTQRKQYVPRP